MSETSEFILSILPALARGTLITLTLFFASVVFGGITAVIVAVSACYGGPILRRCALAYIFCVRGTPILVQLYLGYFGLGLFLGQLPGVRQTFLWPILASSLTYAILVLSLNAGAYVGEVLRGAISNVPRGLVEAATSLGLSGFKGFLLVTLPIAFRSALPALNTEAVIMVKITSLASTIAVMDLMGTAYLIQSETFRTYETLLTAAAIYFVLISMIGYALRALESKLRVGA